MVNWAEILLSQLLYMVVSNSYHIANLEEMYFGTTDNLHLNT